MDSRRPPAHRTPEERVHALLADDAATTSLGIEVVDATEERAHLRWTVPATLTNGLGLLHGGYTFLFADTALAYLCAATGRRAATRSAEITYLEGVLANATLTAEATVRTRTGRTTICDVRVRDEDGKIYAEFRGHAIDRP